MFSFCTFKNLLLAWCMVLTANATAQKLTYKILMNNKVIGTLLGEHIVQKENSTYSMKSDMIVKKIIEFKIEYQIESSFANGKLIKSTVIQKTNHKAHTNTVTQWDGLQYTIQTIDNHFVLKSKNITNNMSTIYYNEPVGLTQIYSDAFGKFLNIRPLAAHRYELTLPDGKKTYYNYASGICFQVESVQMFYKIIFRLIK